MEEMPQMKKILIAEDNDEVLTLYNIALKKRYHLINAKNGREAVNAYQKERPDLVLMDIKMPEMDGDEAIKEIKGMDPGARILAVTMYDDYTEEDLGVEVLKKGFKITDFPEIIERQIAKPGSPISSR
jgi:CheY-like chemotaxis protein